MTWHGTPRETLAVTLGGKHLEQSRAALPRFRTPHLRIFAPHGSVSVLPGWQVICACGFYVRQPDRLRAHGDAVRHLAVCSLEPH